MTNSNFAAFAPPVIGSRHDATLSNQIRLASSLIGTDDQGGKQDARDCLTRIAYVSGALLGALTVAESFMSGFEDDDMQEGMAGMLATVRGAIALAGGAATMPQTPEATFRDLAARAVALFPEIGTDDELNGGDAVERLGEIIPDMAAALAGQVATDAPRLPVLAVEAFDWQEIGNTDEGDPKTRLLSTLQIGDCVFHVEARQIDESADPQTTLEYPDDFERFGDIADQSDFATMQRDGREYFVFILPYEA